MSDPLDAEQSELQREEQQRQAQARADEHKRDVVAFMSSTAGRRYVWKMLAFCGLWSSSYVDGDREAVNFREGQRNVGLKTLKEIRDICPDLEIRMIEENRK